MSSGHVFGLTQLAQEVARLAEVVKVMQEQAVASGAGEGVAAGGVAGGGAKAAGFAVVAGGGGAGGGAGEGARGSAENRGGVVAGVVGGGAGEVSGSGGSGGARAVSKKSSEATGGVGTGARKKLVFGEFGAVEVEGRSGSSDESSVDGSVNAGGSVQSWDEMIEEDQPLGSRGQPLVGTGVTNHSVGSGNFFKTFVRTERVLAYSKFVASRFGVQLPSEALQELALVSYCTGTVPDAFVEGRRRISAWAAVGDAVMALVVVSAMALEGRDVAAVQAVKSSALSNSKLSAVGYNVGVAAHVMFPPGVDPKTTKLGADAFEALCGVLFRFVGLEAVEKVLKVCGFVAKRK